MIEIITFIALDREYYTRNVNVIPISRYFIGNLPVFTIERIFYKCF